MLESFYQSIKCPLQITLVGDPLAQPWASKTGIEISKCEKGQGEGALTVAVKVAPARGSHYGKLMFLVDGRAVKPANGAGLGPGTSGTREAELRPVNMKKGRHTLRVVAYQTGLVRHQVFAEREFDF